MARRYVIILNEFVIFNELVIFNEFVIVVYGPMMRDI